MTWADEVTRVIADGDQAEQQRLLAQMALLLDAPNAPSPSPRASKSTSAERMRRHRERHMPSQSVTSDASQSVTESVTSDGSDASHASHSRAVVTSKAVTSAVTSRSGSSSSNKQRAQFLESDVTREVTRVTENGASHKPSQASQVTARDAAADLVTRLGPEIADKLRDLFRRHEIGAHDQQGWVQTARALLDDKTFKPTDIAAACDDDALNRITKGVMGFRSFVTAARDRRLRSPAEPADPDALAHQISEAVRGRILGRTALNKWGEPWKAWCVEGAKREGLRSWVHFAARNMNHADWPVEPTVENSTNADQGA